MAKLLKSAKNPFKRQNAKKVSLNYKFKSKKRSA